MLLGSMVSPWDLPWKLVLGAGAALILLRVCRRPAFESKSGQPVRRGGSLAMLSLVLGPTLGLTLAAAWIYFGDVSPLDYGYTFQSFGIIGSIAGVVTAISCLISERLGGSIRGKIIDDPLD